MKYIEELENGDSFTNDNKFYLLTCDHKANGQRLCYCLSTGLPQWFDPSTIVSDNPIYYLDSNNNVAPIKESKKHDPFSDVS